MDVLFKGLVTAIAVAVALAVAHRLGRGVAGLLAGMPTVSGPALAWAAVDHGTPFAAEVAVGTVAGSALCALFSLVYVAAGYRGRTSALATALLASFAALPLVFVWISRSGNVAVLLAASAFVGTVCWFGQRWLSAVRKPMAPFGAGQRPRGARIGLTAVVSGAISSVCSAASGDVGPFWIGVMASPPLVAAAVTWNLHASSDRHAMEHVAGFMQGYSAGVLGRGIFATVLATLLVPAGAAIAVLAATAGGCAAVAVLGRCSGWSAAPRAAFNGIPQRVCAAAAAICLLLAGSGDCHAVRDMPVVAKHAQ